MALIELRGFRGMAEVNGELKEVSWDDDEIDGGTLSIHGISLEKANILVSALASGGVKAAGIEPFTATRDAAKTVLETKGATGTGGDSTGPASQPDADGSGSEPPKDPPAKDPKAPETKAPATKTRRRRSKASTKGADAPAEEPASDPAPEKPAEEAAASGEGDNGKAGGDDAPENAGGDPWGLFEGIGKEQIEGLKEQPSLREILGYLMEECGIDKEADLLEICMGLRPHVPVLSRVSRMETRVPRIATSMGAK